MEYSSNIQSVITNLKGKLKNATDITALNKEIGTYLHASNLRRIHNDGQAVQGAIGAYNSLNPIYVNPNKSPKSFPAIGKTGKGVFKNGKKHKTGYFQSYMGFRAKIGREIGFVNLQLSGKLFRDWVIEQNNKDVLIGFRSLYGAEISKGMEQKYKKIIWGVTAKDKEQIVLIQEAFIKKAVA